MSTPQHIPSETDIVNKSLSLISRTQNWWSGPHKTWETINQAIASAHSSVKEVGERSRAELQAWVAVILAFFFILGALASAATRRSLDANEGVLIVLTVVMLVAYGLSRTQYYSWGGWLVTGSVVIAGYGFALTGKGSSTVLDSFIPLAFILGSILLTPWTLLFWVVVGVSTMFFIPASFGLDTGTLSGNYMTLGSLLLVAIIFRNSVERRRLAELRSVNDALRLLQSGLEQRVEDRTKALATTTEVSRRLSTILNQKELVTEVVSQVNNAFGYYHTQIYFFDEPRENLVMAGGTGEAGAMMLAQFHKIAKGRGLVGHAAESNAPVLVSDTSKNPEWLPNPLLPDTKSEVAIPISIGDRVLGVLDVQHNIVNGLKEDDVTSLQSIANQVAVASQNIRQYEDTQKIARDLSVVADVGIATSTITNIGELLQEVVDLSKKSFNLYHAHIYMLNEAGDSLQLTAGAGEVGRQMVSEGRSIPLESEQSLVARAARSQEGVVVNNVTLDPNFLPNPLLPDTHAELAVPMVVGGKVIGVLDVQSETVNRFTSVDVNIKSTLASQIAIAVQNARNFAESKRHAERETAVNLITQKIQSATTIESALQIAARELGQALGKRQTIVALEPSAMEGPGKTAVNE